jgi:hypothetical protein
MATLIGVISPNLLAASAFKNAHYSASPWVKEFKDQLGAVAAKPATPARLRDLGG